MIEDCRRLRTDGGKDDTCNNVKGDQTMYFNQSLNMRGYQEVNILLGVTSSST